MNRMLLVSTCTNSWFGMFATTLRRDRRSGAFDELQQGLLNTFAGYVTGNRWIIRFARNLINFVNVNDAIFGFFDIIIAFLQQVSG